MPRARGQSLGSNINPAEEEDASTKRRASMPESRHDTVASIEDWWNTGGDELLAPSVSDKGEDVYLAGGSIPESGIASVLPLDRDVPVTPDGEGESTAGDKATDSVTVNISAPTDESTVTPEPDEAPTMEDKTSDSSSTAESTPTAEATAARSKIDPDARMEGFAKPAPAPLRAEAQPAPTDTQPASTAVAPAIPPRTRSAVRRGGILKRPSNAQLSSSPNLAPPLGSSTASLPGSSTPDSAVASKPGLDRPKPQKAWSMLDV